MVSRLGTPVIENWLILYRHANVLAFNVVFQILWHTFRQQLVSLYVDIALRALPVGSKVFSVGLHAQHTLNMCLDARPPSVSCLENFLSDCEHNSFRYCKINKLQHVFCQLCPANVVTSVFKKAVTIIHKCQYSHEATIWRHVACAAMHACQHL